MHATRPAQARVNKEISSGARESTESDVADLTNHATISKHTRFPWREVSKEDAINKENGSGNHLGVNSASSSIPRVHSYRKFLDPQVGSYGIQALTIDDDNKGRQCPINPQSNFNTVWKMIMLVSLVVTVIQTPILVAWRFNTKEARTVSSITDVLFMIDFCIQFSKGYVDDNRNLIMNQKQSVMHYLQTWASLDVVSCLPWSLFELHRPFPSAVTLMKMVRILTIRHLLSSVKSLNAVLLTWIRIALIFVSYLCLINTLACVWWYLARSADPSEYPVMNEFPDVSVFIFERSIFFQYTMAIYYIVVTITTLGYGDIVPRSMNQRWFANIILMFTGFLDAFIFGYVVSLVSTFYSFYIQNIQKTRYIRQYMDNNSMPKEMERRIWHYTHHRQHLRARFDTSYVFSGYPHHLVKDVMMYAHYEKLSLLFGEHVENDVLRQLASKLQWTYCVTGEQWAEYGRTGNHAFYLQRGTFLITHPGCCLRTLVGPVGAWYGADMLGGPMKRHKVIIEAIEDCDLFVLTRGDFEEVLRDYPAWRQPLIDHLDLCVGLFPSQSPLVALHLVVTVHLPLHSIGNLRRSIVEDREQMGYHPSSSDYEDECWNRYNSTIRANTVANAISTATGEEVSVNIPMEPSKVDGPRSSTVRFDMAGTEEPRGSRAGGKGSWDQEDSYARRRKGKRTSPLSPSQDDSVYTSTDRMTAKDGIELD
eukprot:Ihof_evm2s407 gene=Ihof_evmTU2s407